jgi:uncharacterized protein (DUF1330 family)
MPAYFLVDILAIKDAAKMDRYRSQVAPVVEKFAGRYLVIGPFHVVEGSYQPLFRFLSNSPAWKMPDAGTIPKSIVNSKTYALRRFRMHSSWKELRLANRARTFVITRHRRL